MKVEQTECSEMSTYKIQMPVRYPEEIIHTSVICWYKKLTFLLPVVASEYEHT